MCPEDVLLVLLVGVLFCQDISIDNLSSRLPLGVIGGMIMTLCPEEFLLVPLEEL